MEFGEGLDDIPIEDSIDRTKTNIWWMDNNKEVITNWLRDH